MENTGENYLLSTKKLFAYYKSLADKAIAQIGNEQLHWQYNNESNSIAVIMQHIAGNCISRWTDFLNSDGEKASRDRDAEFEETGVTKDKLLAFWEQGWKCLFEAIDPLTENDLLRIIYTQRKTYRYRGYQPATGAPALPYRPDSFAGKDDGRERLANADDSERTIETV
jgi:hypothetical protein